MKRVAAIVALWSISFTGASQAQESQQLLLNCEKLAQLKSILDNMYKGYQVVSAGYNKVRDISQGNYKLHQIFLEELLQVSPAVRKYKRVGDIVNYQKKLLQEGKQALTYFKNTGSFTFKECQYMTNVYQNLFERSVQNLDELFLVFTAGKLRMNDDERLAAIDRVFEDIEDKLAFLRSFNTSTKILALQRQQEQNEIELSKKLNAIE